MKKVGSRKLKAKPKTASGRAGGMGGLLAEIAAGKKLKNADLRKLKSKSNEAGSGGKMGGGDMMAMIQAKAAARKLRAAAKT